MEYVVNDRTPLSLFHFFEEISAIPRGSFNERAIAELAECRRTNVWPTKTEDLRILDV